MEPDTPRPSPLAPMDPPEVPTLPMPAPEDAEPPRLGILHLLVLTACVAVYLGISRSFSLAFFSDAIRRPIGTFEATAGSLHGIGRGAALAGLVLFVARRLRGMSFPTHPGEYLLVLTGFGVALNLATTGLLFLVASPLKANSSSAWPYSVFPWAAFGLIALVFLWAFIRVKSPRWRIFLLAIPASHVPWILVLWAWPHLWLLGNSGSRLVIGLVLIVVVLKDHMEGKRYPWTHWFGVGTRLWLDAATMGTSLWLALVGRGPF